MQSRGTLGNPILVLAKRFFENMNCQKCQFCFDSFTKFLWNLVFFRKHTSKTPKSKDSRDKKSCVESNVPAPGPRGVCRELGNIQWVPRGTFTESGELLDISVYRSWEESIRGKSKPWQSRGPGNQSDDDPKILPEMNNSLVMD